MGDTEGLLYPGGPHSVLLDFTPTHPENTVKIYALASVIVGKNNLPICRQTSWQSCLINSLPSPLDLGLEPLFIIFVLVKKKIKRRYLINIESAITSAP